MGQDPKIIVLTGHGAWAPKSVNRQPFTTLPAKCSMHFYTTNFTLMRQDGFGDQLEQGKYGNYMPVQKAGPYQSVPNMVLTWPRGLSISTPPREWTTIVYAKGVQIAPNPQNILFQIKEPKKPLGNLLEDPLGHMFLKDIFDVLHPATFQAKSVLFIWSACRQVMIEKATGLAKNKFTTDDEDIAAVGHDCGLEVPFLRPVELAQDALFSVMP